MMTPALAVDGEVKVVGKVSSPDEIKAMLEQSEFIKRVTKIQKEG